MTSPFELVKRPEGVQSGPVWRSADAREPMSCDSCGLLLDWSQRFLVDFATGAAGHVECPSSGEDPTPLSKEIR